MGITEKSKQDLHVPIWENVQMDKSSCRKMCILFCFEKSKNTTITNNKKSQLLSCIFIMTDIDMRKSENTHSTFCKWRPRGSEVR